MQRSASEALYSCVFTKPLSDELFRQSPQFQAEHYPRGNVQPHVGNHAWLLVAYDRFHVVYQRCLPNYSGDSMTDAELVISFLPYYAMVCWLCLMVYRLCLMVYRTLAPCWKSQMAASSRNSSILLPCPLESHQWP
jgi:hypothetical protein